jgi:hypothetical protein
LASDESAERCGECHGDDLEVVGAREVRRPSRRGEPAAVVARRIDYRCRECGCDGSILRRVEPGHLA